MCLLHLSSQSAALAAWKRPPCTYKHIHWQQRRYRCGLSIRVVSRCLLDVKSRCNAIRGRAAGFISMLVAHV
jgi:hypothetical protein